MKKLSQKGFNVIEVVLLLVVAGLVAGIGGWVWQQRDNSSNASVSDSSQAVDETDEDETGENKAQDKAEGTEDKGESTEDKTEDEDSANEDDGEDAAMTKAEAIAKAKKYKPPAGMMCAQVLTPATHTETGAKYTFSTTCVAPGWKSDRPTY